MILPEDLPSLIGYGLGRPFGFTDEDLANEILSAAKKQDHSVVAFVHSLVQSKAFSTKVMPTSPFSHEQPPFIHTSAMAFNH